MRRIIIDAGDMRDMESLHLVMKEALNLPDHYGRNLDALWDCLMEIRPAELYLRKAQLLEALPEGYGRKLIGLLEQAGEERKDFVFRQTKGWRIENLSSGL